MREYAARTSEAGGFGGTGSSGTLFGQPATPGGGGGGTGGGGPGGGSSGSSGAAGGGGWGGVQAMAWVMPGHHVLAVVVAPALLLLWDVHGESQGQGCLGWCGRLPGCLLCAERVGLLYHQQTAKGCRFSVCCRQ